MKFSKALLATLLFLLLFSAAYSVHAAFFRVNVVLYSAVADGLLSVLATGVILFGARAFRVFNAFEKLQLVVIWMLLSCLLAVVVPTVIDRSLSFYILEKLQQRGGGIRQDRFEDVFREYAREHRLADVRLTEQLESGTIVIRDGCVQLTPRGERLATFSRFFRQHLLPKQRLLLGEYSDALTDPFRGSEASPGYDCR